MNISKKYIEMCEKAEEVQALFNNFDETGYCSIVAIKGETYVVPYEIYWLEKYGNEKICRQWVAGYWESDNPHYYGSKAVWLPRQDQLQEMINLDPIDASIKIGEWGNCQGDDFDSMEQLWLAFVMKEKYQKVWNGKDWI